MSNWDYEYKKQGIPSSYRDKPSGVLTWGLTNLPYLVNNEGNLTALDIGCGTGRNAVYMASEGINVIAFDSSQIAIERAHERLKEVTLPITPNFFKHNLTDGLPFESETFDFISDIFVYKHQLPPKARNDYRAELKRVLKPNGKFLLSLAAKDDGYYSKCPDLNLYKSNPRTVVDPIVNIGSVLFNLDDLISEMCDTFELEMSWSKVKQGKMHGNYYLRHTIATIWRKKEMFNETS